MTAAWPAGVSQYAETGSFKETPEKNKVSFQPEVGPAIERRRTSIASDLISFQTQMNYADFVTLKNFWRDDCVDGTQPFTRKHPYDIAGSDLTFKFTAEPSFSDVNKAVDIGLVSIALRLMP